LKGFCSGPKEVTLDVGGSGGGDMLGIVDVDCVCIGRTLMDFTL